MNPSHEPGVITHLRQFIEAAPSPTLLVGDDGRIVLMNSQAEQIFQYRYDELVGQPVEILIPARFHHDHVSDRMRFVADPQTRPIGTRHELRAIRKDGHEFPVEVGLNVLEADGVTYIVTSIVDISERKHHENLFSQLFQHSPDATVVVDNGGCIALVNIRAEEMFGYTSEELIGQPIEMLVPAHMRGKHVAEVKNYNENPRMRPMGTNGRFCAQRKDGTQIPVEISLAPVRTDRGLMVFSSIRDVTEHRRLIGEIEGNLEIQRATAQILRMSLASLPLGALLDQALDLLLAVPWLGQEAQGCLFLVEDDPEMLILQAQRRLPAGVVKQCQRVPLGQCVCGAAALHREIVFAADGTDCHTRSSDVPDHIHYCVPLQTDGQMLGVLNIYVPPDHKRRQEQEDFLSAMADLLAGLVKRRHAEIGQQESEERFELAVRGTNVGIWDWDLRTDRVYFSPRWKNIIGYGPDEIPNDFAEWEKRLHPDDRERALATVRDYLEGRSKEYELEHRLRHKDGSYRWILARGAAVFDEKGRPYRMVGSHLDTTRRHEAEEQLRESRAQLLAAQRIQERLLPQSPPQVPGLEIAGACFAAEYAAGDYYDFLTLPDGSVGLVIADVMGHGVGPALLMATTSAYIRALAAASLPMAEIVTQTNNMLCEQTDGSWFITLLFCRLDPARGSFHYVNAGHPRPHVIDSDGELKATSQAGGLPLGMVPDREYVEAQFADLVIGDTILLLTDGLFEARPPNGELFGKQRVLDVICAHRDNSAAEILQRIRREVCSFTKVDSLQDDLTMIVVKVMAPPNAST